MKKLNKKINFKIASDGSSASGKTTGGKLISKKFNMKFLSSGSLYRFCALKILSYSASREISHGQHNAKGIKVPFLF